MILTWHQLKKRVKLFTTFEFTKKNYNLYNSQNYPNPTTLETNQIWNNLNSKWSELEII